MRPALEAAGGRYLSRGGAHAVYEGTWEPARLVLIEFPSQEAWESFTRGSAYEGIKTIRDETSTANMVGVGDRAAGSTESTDTQRREARGRTPTRSAGCCPS